MYFILVLVSKVVFTKCSMVYRHMFRAKRSCCHRVKMVSVFCCPKWQHFQSIKYFLHNNIPYHTVVLYHFKFSDSSLVPPVLWWLCEIVNRKVFIKSDFGIITVYYIRWHNSSRKFFRQRCFYIVTNRTKKNRLKGYKKLIYLYLDSKRHAQKQIRRVDLSKYAEHCV